MNSSTIRLWLFATVAVAVFAAFETLIFYPWDEPQWKMYNLLCVIIFVLASLSAAWLFRSLQNPAEKS